MVGRFCMVKYGRVGDIRVGDGMVKYGRVGDIRVGGGMVRVGIGIEEDNLRGIATR